ALDFENRGLSYYAKHDLRDATADYTAAIAAEPDYAWPYHDRSRARFYAVDASGALADLRVWYRLNKQGAASEDAFCFGLALYGTASDALAHCDRAVAAEPD